MKPMTSADKTDVYLADLLPIYMTSQVQFCDVNVDTVRIPFLILEDSSLYASNAREVRWRLSCKVGYCKVKHAQNNPVVYSLHARGKC